MNRLKPGIVVHTFNPSSQEAEQVDLRPAWFAEGIPSWTARATQSWTKRKIDSTNPYLGKLHIAAWNLRGSTVLKTIVLSYDCGFPVVVSGYLQWNTHLTKSKPNI